MKPAARRHTASLAFICCLAIIYLAILLIGKAGDTPPADNATVTRTAIHPPGDTGCDSTPGKISRTDVNRDTPRSSRKATGSGKQRKVRTPTTDNPDVLDLPIPSIHR